MRQKLAVQDIEAYCLDLESDNQRKKFMTNLVEGHKKYKEKEKECFEKEKKRLEEKN